LFVEFGADTVHFGDIDLSFEGMLLTVIDNPVGQHPPDPRQQFERIDRRGVRVEDKATGQFALGIPQYYR